MAGVALSRPTFAQQTVHIVEMRSGNIYVPEYLEVAVGDLVRFVNVSGGHNSESIAGMIPEGAQRWKSRLRETFDLEINQVGVYGYKCTPHYSRGMVGLIVAGDPTVNLEAAKSVKTPQRAAAVFERLFAQIS